MKSIRCPECNLMDWAEADVCKRCGYAFQEVAQEIPEEQYEEQQYDEHAAFEADEYPAEEPYYDEGDGQQAEHYSHPNQDNTNHSSHYSVVKPSIRFALTSMVFGIIGMPLFSMIWGTILAGILAVFLGIVGVMIGGGIAVLIVPVGLIFGIVALVRANKRPAEYGGKGFAIAGVVCNSIWLVVLPLILAIAIPNLLAARRAANEGAALANMEKLSIAETTFRKANNGRCASLGDLGRFNVIDAVLAAGQKTGYRYMVVNLPTADGGCEIMAVPIDKTVGSRSFFFSTEDRVLRVAEKNGALAAKTDPPIGAGTSKRIPQISSKKY